MEQVRNHMGVSVLDGGSHSYTIIARIIKFRDNCLERSDPPFHRLALFLDVLAMEYMVYMAGW